MLLLCAAYVQPHGHQKLNELADFSDIVEPDSSKSEEAGDVVQDDVKQRETRASLFKNVADEFSGSRKTQNPIQSEDLGKHKRDVAKKYKDLLDLKYYLARSFPKTNTGLRNLSTYSVNKRDIRKSSRERRKKRRSNKTGHVDEKQVRQVKGVNEGKANRTRLNILPMMAENNPYIKKLADATNDEYLKMRNYAATMMIILTTNRPPTTANQEEQRRSFEKTLYVDEDKPAISQDLEETGRSSENELRPGVNLQNVKRKDCVLDKHGNCEMRLSSNANLDSKKPHREEDVSKTGTNEGSLFLYRQQAKAPMSNEGSSLNNENVVHNKNAVTETSVTFVKSANVHNKFTKQPKTTRKSHKLGYGGIDKNQNTPSPSLSREQYDKDVPLTNSKHTSANSSHPNVGKYDDAAKVAQNQTSNGQNSEALRGQSNNVQSESKFGVYNSKEDDLSKKQTTESSYVWENNLLKGVDFKLKRRDVISKLGPGSRRSATSVVQRSDPLEMQKKFLTSVTNSSLSCNVDRIPDAEENNCEESESGEEESCAETVAGNSSCQLGAVGRVQRHLREVTHIVLCHIYK